MPEITISDETRAVNFSWDFIWKVFLAILVISVISAILTAIGVMFTGDDFKTRMRLKYGRPQ